MDPVLTAWLDRLTLRLDAAGLSFGGLQWTIIAPLWKPEGFDFVCEDHRRLQAMVEASPRFGEHAIAMPGNDHWRRCGILSTGYSQIGLPGYLHLDIAANRPGLCRVYVAPREAGAWTGPAAFAAPAETSLGGLVPAFVAG